jgi:regulatory protein SWI6
MFRRVRYHPTRLILDIAAIFETINDTFAAEMTAKQTKLNATEQSVRHATRALSDKRQQVQRAQSAVSELEQVRQKVENVKRAMQVVESQDWTGRLSEGRPPVSVAARHEDMEIPSKGEGIDRLRRMVIWENRIGKVLEDKTRDLEGDSAERAVKYRRLVSLCTKVPVDKVDGVSLSPLSLADRRCWRD